jgi:hypothetical protein
MLQFSISLNLFSMSIGVFQQIDDALSGLAGKKAKEIAYQFPNLMKVDVSSLPEGVYLARLQWQDDHLTARIVVRR